VLALDHARRALAAGDATAALDLVDAYDARYPSGSLVQESAELRIEALFRAGRRGEAEKLAEHFLAAHPTSPYARVIRSLSAGARPAP
jgi:outer membrane protein assembly factor BamD (BamD/ComL family)